MKDRSFAWDRNLFLPTWLHLQTSVNILSKIRPATFRKRSSHVYYDHNGNANIQTNGVSIGNYLGAAFPIGYMSHVESKLFETIDEPHIYTRYVDDIFV